MKADELRLPAIGRFYEPVVVDDTIVALSLIDEALPDVRVHEGVLVGDLVLVSSRAVLVCGDGDDLRGRPMDPIATRDGRLCFDPMDGGFRTRENRLAAGAHNAAIAEATKFGMVNAFAHANRVARHIATLLAQLGAKPMPRLPVIVGAHSGSRLGGFAEGDGDYRSGRMRPLSGGHYRLSQRTTGVPEPHPVLPSGEVHLGPGRLRQFYAGRDGYLRGAAHNPATIYHEYGHHVSRHTADFRLNAERAAAEQRNGKPGIEEGFCDYLAASMLKTGRPYGWYGVRRGERRDPSAWASGDDSARAEDAYEVGARWAAFWWHCRQRLQDCGRLAAPDHDRALVATLLTLGETATQGHGSRRLRHARRGSPETVLAAYLDAVRAQGGPRAVDAIGDLATGASDWTSPAVQVGLSC